MTISRFLNLLKEDVGLQLVVVIIGVAFIVGGFFLFLWWWRTHVTVETTNEDGYHALSATVRSSTSAPSPDDEEVDADEEEEKEEKEEDVDEEDDPAKMEYPPVLIIVNRVAEQLVIKCNDFDGYSTSANYLSFRWEDNGLVTIFDGAGNVLDTIDSDECEKQRGWNDVVSWKIINYDDYPSLPYELESDFIFNQKVKLVLNVDREIIIEMDDYNELYESTGEVTFEIEDYGFVRITENGVSTLYDSDNGGIIFSYSNIKSWSMD